MAAREDLKMRLTRLRGQTARLGRTGLSGPAVLRTAEVGIHLMLAAVLAGAEVFGGFAPFGVFKIEDGKMDLMISSQIGSMQDQIQMEKEGKDLIIGFNPKFLVDALRVIDEEEITMYMINSIAPCIIRDEQVSYLYLILPINVNNSGI